MLLTKMINFLKQINLVVNFRSLSNIVDQREGTQGIDQRSSKAHVAIWISMRALSYSFQKLFVSLALLVFHWVPSNKQDPGKELALLLKIHLFSRKITIKYTMPVPQNVYLSFYLCHRLIQKVRSCLLLQIRFGKEKPYFEFKSWVCHGDLSFA